MRRPWAGLRGPSTPLPQPTRSLESKGAIDRRHSAGPTYSFAGSPYVAPIGSSDLDRVVRDQYERDLWVWRAVDARAKNAAKLDVVVRTGRGKGSTVIEDHPLSRILNRKANLHESAQAFRYRLHSLLDLSVTKGVFVEVLENNAGDVGAMHLLNPLHTWPIPDPDVFVSKYEMRLPSGEVFDELPPYRPGRGGVLWIKRPHPTDPYRSTSWLEAAALTIELDYFALRYSRNFLMNDGRPGGVLMVKSEDGIEPADAEILQARMSGGPENAGRVTVMEAEALEYLDLSKTARDAQYVEARQMTQREILVAAGTPLSVIGDASGQTFENSDADERLFWRNEMVPEVELVASYWEELTDGGVHDDSEVVGYDWTKVAVLQREQVAIEGRAQAEYDKGLITVDEYRELTGKDPLNLPGTRVLWTVSGRAPIGSETDVTALLTQGMQQPAVEAPAATSAAQLEGGPQPSLPVGSGLPGDDGDVIEGELVPDPLERQLKRLAAMPSGYLTDRRKAHDELLTRWETAVIDALVAVSKRQEEVVLARLTGAKARRHTRHWTYEGGYRGGELKALDPAYVLDRARWITELVDALAELVMAAFRAAGLATAEQLGRSTFEPPPAAGEVVARAVRQIAQAYDARAERVQDVIATADLEGQPIDAIADAVRTAYESGPTWAEVAAQPVIGTVNAASLASARQSGALAKRWLATDDERTRKTHRTAEGQVVAMDDLFTVGKAKLLYPHDPSGPIGETIYCRCTMIYQLGALPDDPDEPQWKALPNLPGGPAFDLEAYALDVDGRFLDVPAVLTPDGKSGRALAVDQGSVTVRRDDGRVLCVSADDLTPA